MTIVLKFPLTTEASTNGLHRYRGFGPWETGDDGTGGGRAVSAMGKVAELGVVGDLRGFLGARRL